MHLESFGRNQWLGGLFGVAAVFLPFRGVAAQQSQEQVSEGAAVYGRMCGRCHNPRSPLEHTDAEWITIANHMRVRANLTGAEIRAVLAFVQATNTSPLELATLPVADPQQLRPAAPSVPTGPASDAPEAIERGGALVTEKACVGCHVIGKTGGPVGPSLNGVVRRRGAVFVRQKLAAPSFDNPTSMMPNFGLTQEQIEAIVAYLATLDGR